MVKLNFFGVADAVDSNGDAVDSNGSSAVSDEVDQKGSSANVVDDDGRSVCEQWVKLLWRIGYVDHSELSPLFGITVDPPTPIFRGTITDYRKFRYDYEKVIKHIVLMEWGEIVWRKDPEKDDMPDIFSDEYRQTWAECIEHIPVEEDTAPVE